MDTPVRAKTVTSDLQKPLDSLNQCTKLEKSASAHSGCGMLLVLCAVSVASLSGLMLGYQMGLISGVLLQLRELLSLSCPQQEQAVGAPLLGALLLSLLGGSVVDRYGRRFSIILTAALCVGGTLLSTCVVSFWALIVGRAMVGMATALSGTASCLYMAEVAPQAWRGRCVCAYELMVVLGVLLGFSISWALAGTPEGWRYTLGGAVPPALLQLAVMPFLPCSPRFLLARRREEEAYGVLVRLRGTWLKEAVEEELRDIRAALGAERQHEFRDLFSSQDNMRWRLGVGVALVVLQQVTGQPNLLAYASTVLRSVGFHSNEAATLASTGLGVVKVAGTIPAMLLVDRVGPKAFLCVGAVVMTLSTVTLGAVTMQSQTQVSSLCQAPTGVNHTSLVWTNGAAARTDSPLGLYRPDLFHTDSLNHTLYSISSTQTGNVSLIRNINFTKDYGIDLEVSRRTGDDSRIELEVTSVSSSLKWISLVSLLVYVTGFSFSLGPMVHVVLSEIFPTGIRGKAVSVVSAFNWASNLLISMTFLTLTEWIGLPNVIFSYAAMSFILLVFVILFVPETKGRTLEQISKELAMKNHLDGSLLCLRRRTQMKTDTPKEEKTLTSV
ncbi:solute carrier family 2, facilitated glucose transporter member 12 [Chanos chanos]|uniref:Solute carrier family 2, facilitated glucose transporter member 12 n=1 Tax=Chanos chanos TaxID=29144 RepID=A0A6J2WFL4_CHACN|nr:solute carrier family 2, facilitated glucose transporter member 12 [Chanos chanos]